MIKCTCDRCGCDLPYVSLVNVFHAEMKDLIPPYDGYGSDKEWDVHLCSRCKEDVMKEVEGIVIKKVVRPQNPNMQLASATCIAPAVEFKMEEVKFPSARQNGCHNCKYSRKTTFYSDNAIDGTHEEYCECILNAPTFYEINHTCKDWKEKEITDIYGG